jgi:murein DD-endopeptidase MepM/ murein hydrolase activator NlpD
MTRTFSLLLAALTSLTAASALPVVSGGAETPPRTVDVVPGAVVRWETRAGDWCGNGVETWEPLRGACYFGVDVRRAPGTLEVALIREQERETALLNVLPSRYPEERLSLDPRKVKLSKRDQERVNLEWKEVLPLFDLRGSARFSLPLAAPLAGSPPVHNFGTRRILNGEAHSPHGGADYRAAVGTPVHAVAPGRVVLVTNHFFSGRSVYVDHGDGLLSMSMHLSRVDVAKGQEVRTGDRLGLSGATGRVSGPHLHFGLRWRGAIVDPEALVGPETRTVAIPPAG